MQEHLHGVYLSTDNGYSWAFINAQSGLQMQSVNSLAIMGTNLFVGTGYNGVFRSTNNGTDFSILLL